MAQSGHHHKSLATASHCIRPRQFVWKSLVLSSCWKRSLYVFSPSPLLRWNQVSWGSWMSFSQKSHDLVPGSVRAYHTTAALWLLLKGWEGAASWSDICRCQWGDRSPAGERQWIPMLCGASVADTKLPSLFLGQIYSFRWALHTLPASVAGVLRRAPRNIFIVPGGVASIARYNSSLACL